MIFENLKLKDRSFNILIKKVKLEKSSFRHTSTSSMTDKQYNNYLRLQII